MLNTLKLESCLSKTSDLHLFFRVVKDNKMNVVLSAALMVIFLLLIVCLWAFDSVTSKPDGWSEVIGIFAGTLSSFSLLLSYDYMKKRAFRKRLMLLPEEYHGYDRNYFLRFIMFLEEAKVRGICDRKVFAESSKFLGEDLVSSNRLGLSNSFSFVLSAGLAIFFIQKIYEKVPLEVQVVILIFSSLFIVLSAFNIWSKNIDFSRKTTLRQYCHWASALDERFFELFKKQK